MYENFRVFFSILWFVSFGCSVASLLAVVVSWGGYLEYLYASLILLGVATAGAIVTSL